MLTETNKTLRTCAQGHQYYKSSDCPICPECEKKRKPLTGFLSLLSAPARRALENEGITTLEKISNYREKDILKLHGIGPSSMPSLRKSMEEAGLRFKD